MTCILLYPCRISTYLGIEEVRSVLPIITESGQLQKRIRHIVIKLHKLTQEIVSYLARGYLLQTIEKFEQYAPIYGYRTIIIRLCIKLALSCLSYNVYHCL